MTIEGYSSDRPLEDRNDDRLNRREFAERMARTLGDRISPDSLVVGLYGRWGSGKSTVLNFMEACLEEEFSDKVAIVRYNPWIYSNDEEMLEAFFGLVAQTLKISLTSNAARAGEILKKFGGLFSVVPFVGSAAADVAKAAGTVLTNRDLEQLKVDFAELLQEADLRVVVLIDDIDRLMLGQLLSIFRLVKLVADFDNTCYVLAFDDLVVKTALESGPTYELPIGPRYLEKIVQIPLQIPEADELVTGELFLQELNSIYKRNSFFKELLPDDFDRLGLAIGHLQTLVSSQRLSKRVSNVLEFSLPMLVGEVNVADMTVLEAVRVIEPDLYVVMREARHDLVSGDHELVTAWLEGKPGSVRLTALGELVSLLFPRSESNAELDAERSRARRICSKEYLDRYFLYGAKAGTVSDRALAAFVAAPSVPDSTDWIDDALSNRTYDFAYKLRNMVQEMSEPLAIEIAEAIVARSLRVPDELGPAGISQLVDRVAMLLSDLASLSATPSIHLLDWAKSCEDRNLSLAIVHWSHIDGSTSPLSSEGQEALMQALLPHVTSATAMDSLTDTSLRTLVRHAGRCVSSGVLRSAVDEWVGSAQNVSRLVEAALGGQGSMIVRTGYDMLARFLDPAEATEILVTGEHDEALRLLDRNETFHPPWLD